MTDRSLYAATALALTLANPAWAQGAPAAETSAQDVPREPAIRGGQLTDQASEPPAPPSAETDPLIAGDIVVTANRRAEPLQRVGIAVNAFSGEQLQALGITNSQDITKFAPAVSSTGAQGGFLQTISIRGVTQNDYNPNQEGPVAVYADDVYISSLHGQSFATFDTERVEILKGPQGTLFGRNATGGLVNYISVKPGDEYSGYLNAQYGRFDDREFQGAIGGPVAGDAVMFRVAAFHSAHGPILRNPIGPDGWREKSYAARAHLLVRPGDAFEALFTARFGEARISTSQAAQFPAQIAILDANGNQIDGRFLGPDETAQFITPSGPTGTRPVPGGDFFGYRDPDGPGRISADPLIGGPVSFTTNTGLDDNFSRTWGGTARFTGRIGDVTLVNITDYSHVKLRVATNLVGGDNLRFGFDTFADGIDQLSNEFRLSGDHDAFRWTTGAYYLNIDVDAGSAYGFFPGGLTGDGTVPGDFRFLYRQRTSSVSGFAQAEYDLSPQWTVIAGGRIIRERKTFDYSADLVQANGQVFFNLATFNPRTTPFARLAQTLHAYKFGVNYKPSDRVLLYATVNRGVKAGGYNVPTNPSALTFEGYVFEPEILLAYEAGFKTTLVDRRLILNGGGFYYDYSDYQGYRNIGVTNFIVNSDARVYGAELELKATPVPRLSVLLGGAYTNALVRDVQLAPGFTPDRRTAFTPRWQANGLVQYDVPTSIGTLGLQADASWRSTYFLQLVNYQDMRQRGYALVNARVSLTDEDAGWQLYAAGRNLTDERYQTSSFDVSATLGSGNVSYSLPRTWEAGVRFSF